MATNCPQQVKPRAWRSACVRLTSAWNSVRGNSLSNWLNMLQNALTGEPPVGGGVEPCRVPTSPYRRGLIRSQCQFGQEWHLIYPEFDPRRPIGPGERWSFRFSRPGTWKFHDHLTPDMTG